MKQAENNEIDTLLRNLARRERAGQSAPGSASAAVSNQGVHLDIDELSSYAERALPPSARARCTAHLADCDDCRKIVAQLSMAAGPLAEEHKSPAAVVPGLTWIQKLSAFFSPRLIRYVAPALVLVVVVFAFFGWRQQQADKHSQFVAVNQVQTPPGAGSVDAARSANDRPTENDSKTTGGIKSTDQKEVKAPAPASAPVATPADSTDSDRSEEKKAAGEAGTTVAPAKAGKADAPATETATQPAYATEPAPPPPAKQQASVSTTQEQQQQKDLAKNNTDNIERGRDANVQRKGPARNESDVANQRGGPAKPAAKAKAADKAAGAANAADDEAETRTVFGRYFRRVGNAWVDTAYNSSMSIRSVTRGTDSYRALIADEPAIEGFGKQLSGEVIVVWKGRAYRIN